MDASKLFRKQRDFLMKVMARTALRALIQPDKTELSA
jgi:hypothetical protein